MSKRSTVLVIDVGLTNCKVSLFDFAGKLIALESQRYPTLNPQSDWSEQDPQDWWKAIQISVRALRDHAEATDTEIAVIGVTAHMHGVIAVDRDGQPLTRCWTLFDRRAVAQAEAIGQSIGLAASYQITGGRLEAYTPAAKIAWLKHHLPEIFAKTALFLAPKDMVRRQLGGEAVTDPIDAAGMLLYNLQKGGWSDDILQAVGIGREKLPEVWAASALAGRLSKEAASELGLPDGIPLLVGAGDDIEAVGAGAVSPGQTLEHIGTTGTLITCLVTPIFDPHQRVEVYPHGLPERYLLGGATNAAGLSLDWAQRFLAFDHHNADLPLNYPPSPNTVELPLYLPYINGERGLLWEAHATGAFLGLREAHTAYDLACGVYEGVALSLKEIITANQKLGAPLTEIISGTPDIHRAWTQLRADVYGFPIAFPEAPYLTGLGAALLALVNQQVFVDLIQAVESCCRLSYRVEPQPERAAYYKERFAVYQRAIQANGHFMGSVNLTP